MTNVNLRTSRALTPAMIVLATACLGACATHPKAPPAPIARAAPAPPPEAPAPVPPSAEIQTQILPGSSQDFVVNVGDRVYFDLNQYAIRADGQPILASQATWLGRYPAVQVRIEGNCDERGTREYNLALGARRANSVKVFLVDHGVDASRITTISYGKERPIDPGTGEDAWQHNRNAHAAITSGAP